MSRFLTVNTISHSSTPASSLSPKGMLSLSTFYFNYSV